MQLDTIIPLRSVGDLILGSKEKEITQALGSAEYRSVDDFGDVELEYVGLGIRCTFWRFAEFRLGYISVERPTASLLDHKLHGQPKSTILRFIDDELQSTVSEADGCTHSDDSVQEWVDVDTHGLTFWFWDDSLYLIDISCPWSDGETPNWPDTDA